MKYISVVISLLVPLATISQTPAGVFEATRDIGPVLHHGTTEYNENVQSYSLKGSGANIWFTKDEFHYAYNQLYGDFILHTRGNLVGAGVDPHRKFGWMIRTGLDPGAAMVCAAVHGDGLTALQYRKKDGTNIEEVKSPILMPDVIQLERRGRSFFLSVAHFGKPFWTVEVPDFDFPDSLYAGLFVCAHNKDVFETAVFDNVRITIPAKPDFRPYQDYLGSHLEIVDIQTGQRRLLYSTSQVIQAPNWTPDGKTLIYNAGGLIYTYDLASGTHAQINTDFVKDNNNDHVITFDGNMLGLSSASGDPEYGSLIYTVPISGGVPKLITLHGPSYLHGWSPDGQWLTYTGERNGEYDIYKIPASGGDEVRLTYTPGLDDGSEFSPDGQLIYYNSVRSGKMELWRMRADGSEQTQLTDDEYQNWFPHVSPDGRMIVFLSYMPVVNAQDHPYYKHVYLRRIAVDGGKPGVIAYLYGGQGTINVPSWSPDSRYVAFVSNSRM